MTVTGLLKEKVLFLDGGMGTMLQKKGLDPGDKPEMFNLSRPAAVQEVHEAYLAAGSNIILTNTFGANRLNYSPDEAEKIIEEGLRIAKAAIAGTEAGIASSIASGIADGIASGMVEDPADDAAASAERFVALDIGPSGRLMEPYGDLAFEEAVDIFADMVRAGVKYGADLIFIETMSDLYETKAALLAAKENSDLPVFVSNSYQASGKLMTGADPAAMITLLEGMGADAIGMNCSLGPEQLGPVVDAYLKMASVPVLVKPNAGLPRKDGDQVAYDISAETFADITAEFALKGARILGGCCGTTPQYISLLSGKLKEKEKDAGPLVPAKGSGTFISSHTHAIDQAANNSPAVSLLSGNSIDELVDSAYDLEDDFDILELDTTAVGSDEKDFIKEAVFEIQSAVRNPLILTAKDPAALEAALRVYKGKAAIRPTGDSKEYREKLLDAVHRYGGVIL